MKVKRYDSDDVRKVLAGMATDTAVCSRVASRWRPPGLFDSSWANTAGQLCVDHVRRYGTSPNGQMRSIFEQWAAERQIDDPTREGMERFLRYVSDEHAENGGYATDYLLDVAGRLFNRVLAGRAIEEAQGLLDVGKADEAVAALSGIGKVELGSGEVVNLDDDPEVWEQAFSPEKRRPLVTWQGKAGKSLNAAFCRGALIGVMGPDKSFKSWFLIDVAFRALRNRHRVLYVEAGDLLQDEVIVRLGLRAAGQPLEPETVKVLTEWADEEENRTYKSTTYSRGLGPRGAMRAFRKACRTRKNPFRLVCHPAGTISVDGIASLIEGMERDGWGPPDVVVIDYADILAPPERVRETLDQIDETWKRLRRISQRWHCLVVTATQSSAEAYRIGDGKKTLGRKHFSGRKTKLAHVNGMLGLNCTEEEREAGVLRINWVVRRNARYSESNWTRVSGSVAIGRLILHSI